MLTTVPHRFPTAHGWKHGETPIARIDVAWPLAGLDGLVLTADLQGLAEGDRPLPLAVLDELAVLAELGEIPPLERMGALLAGDLFCGDKRSASGDVTPIWQAFAAAFRLIAGVAGNHDRFLTPPPVHLLDGESVALGGLTVSGLGGIVGRPEKPQRRPEADYCRELRKILRRGSDLLLLHEPPQAGDELGNVAVRRVLEEVRPSGLGVVVCGHAHWHDWRRRVGGYEVLNVDGRVVVALPERRGADG